MEYTIKKLAQMSGVTTRTLRYYDQIGLLLPARVAPNGYRMYGEEEVDLLQHILFYRELGLSLREIAQIIKNPGFDRKKALEDHLSELLLRKKQIEELICTVTKTINVKKGEISMSDKEKFEGFKKKMIKENEEKYGDEIREKYGDDVIDASNAKVWGMSENDCQRARELSDRINETLKEAFYEGDPAGSKAQKACELHKEWLCMFWQDGMYTKEMHKALADGYVEDERFTAYYDKIAVGCTKFLRDAIYIYCEE
jgi:DNA-binding transcriptional MerR regulator